MNDESSRVLVIAAHPDDEVLGCGGTIARLSSRGAQVFVGILGEGLTSRDDRRRQATPDALASLRDDARRAAQIVGAGEPMFEALPDNRFDTVPLLDVVKVIERWIERIGPRTVYTQHGGDLNIDHAVTFRATLTATRTLAGQPVRDLYAYEVPSSTEVAFGRFEPAFRPNFFVEIAGTLESKIRAMQAYGSEARPFPHPRSPEALRATARRWGSVAGVEAAEAFELIRSVR